MSEHFTDNEFRDHRTGEVKIVPELVQALERLRAIVGRPLRIVSGYRSASTNQAVGGARHSQHLTGRAADIPSRYATISQAKDAGFTGIGYRGPWVVHVDVRGGPVTVFRDP